MSKRLFVIDPESDSPEDVRAAEIAQRIVDSDAFIESYQRRIREAGSRLTEKMLRGEAVTAEELFRD